MAWSLWKTYRETDWAWVPTIQGWTVEDYRYHAQEMRPLLEEMRAAYSGREWRVGIGTLCRRASVSMIIQVIRAISEELPGFDFHLWGVKLSTFKARIHLPHVVSADSAMWHGGWETFLDPTERNESGLSKRRFDYEVCLPRYAGKLAAALSQNKQMALF